MEINWEVYDPGDNQRQRGPEKDERRVEWLARKEREPGCPPFASMVRLLERRLYPPCRHAGPCRAGGGKTYGRAAVDEAKLPDKGPGHKGGRLDDEQIIPSSSISSRTIHLPTCSPRSSPKAFEATNRKMMVLEKVQEKSLLLRYIRDAERKAISCLCSDPYRSIGRSGWKRPTRLFSIVANQSSEGTCGRPRKTMARER